MHIFHTNKCPLHVHVKGWQLRCLLWRKGLWKNISGELSLLPFRYIYFLALDFWNKFQELQQYSMFELYFALVWMPEHLLALILPVYSMHICSFRWLGMLQGCWRLRLSYLVLLVFLFLQVSLSKTFTLILKCTEQYPPINAGSRSDHADTMK